MKNNSNLEKIKVNVKDEFYKNGGFHVYGAEIQTKNTGSIVTIEEISIQTNDFELIGGGEKTLNGFFTMYKGKKTFKCLSEEINLNDEETQINILSQVKGISYSKGLDILEMLKENNLSLDVFKNSNYENIPQIKGFGEKSRKKFFPEITETLKKLENNDLLQELKIMFHGKLNAKKIKKLSDLLNCDFNEFDEETIEIIYNAKIQIDKDNKNLVPLQNQPYAIFIEVLECSFSQADKIATEILHVDKNNKERLIYLTEYLLKKEISNSGSTFTDVETFENKIKSENFIEENKIENFLQENERLINEDYKIFPKNLYYGEISISNSIKYFSEFDKKIDEEKIKIFIDRFEKMNNIKYDDSQKKSIIETVNSGVSVICGGAGCGKTTILKCILYILRNYGFENTLTAPTGKAACRMSESTNIKATTLHSFYYSNLTKLLVDNKSNKKSKSFLEINEKVFVIDESSMIDVDICSKVLNLILKLDYTKLIFVGDPFQLPSVGSGNILKDIIESGVVNVQTLTTIHRQGKENSIIDYSLKIRNQNPIKFDILNNQLYCKKVNEIEDYIKNILKFYAHIKAKEEYKNDIDKFYNDVQIIIPNKRGEISTSKLNEIIKNKYNPGNYKEGKIEYNFKKNDKIMCIKNKKDKNISNGDVGRCVEINKSGFKVYFHTMGEIIQFETGDKEDFNLAYCCTVHKLQGSEYKFIIFAIQQNSPLMDSCLLYTGITRAKQTAILLSNKELINKVISRKNLNFRNTMLKDRLIKDFSIDETEKVNKEINNVK